MHAGGENLFTRWGLLLLPAQGTEGPNYSYWKWTDLIKGREGRTLLIFSYLSDPLKSLAA